MWGGGGGEGEGPACVSHDRYARFMLTEATVQKLDFKKVVIWPRKLFTDVIEEPHSQTREAWDEATLATTQCSSDFCLRIFARVLLCSAGQNPIGYDVFGYGWPCNAAVVSFHTRLVLVYNTNGASIVSIFN